MQSQEIDFSDYLKALFKKDGAKCPRKVMFLGTGSSSNEVVNVVYVNKWSLNTKSKLYPETDICLWYSWSDDSRGRNAYIPQPGQYYVGDIRLARYKSRLVSSKNIRLPTTEIYLFPKRLG